MTFKAHYKCIELYRIKEFINKKIKQCKQIYYSCYIKKNVFLNLFYQFQILYIIEIQNNDLVFYIFIRVLII